MACPFLDRPFKQCLSILTLENIEEATSLCGNDFTSCPIFIKNFNKMKSRWPRILRRER